VERLQSKYLCCGHTLLVGIRFQCIVEGAAVEDKPDPDPSPNPDPKPKLKLDLTILLNLNPTPTLTTSSLWTVPRLMEIESRLLPCGLHVVGSPPTAAEAVATLVNIAGKYLSHLFKLVTIAVEEQSLN